MRRFAVPACLLLAAAATGSTVALAASPTRGATYSGSLADYYNNGSRYRTARGLQERASFTVSRDGTRILHFIGNYSYYCGAGRSAIRADALKIVHGRFGGTGSHVEKRVGTNYFALVGRFGAHGTATITYLDDFVAKGQHVADPYSMAYHSPSRACESKVTGTLTTGRSSDR